MNDGRLTATPIFYDAEAKTMTMVMDGSDAEYALVALLRALVFADRDAELDLHAAFLDAGTVDRERALAALIAGEATFYTNLARARDTDYTTSAERILYTSLLDSAQRCP